MMGLIDFLNRGRPGGGGNRLGGLAAMAQAMSDPSYHRAGMLGPMLLAGGGAAMGSRRYDQDLARQREEEEAERARQLELEEEQRAMQRELHRLRVRDLSGDIDSERSGRERERAVRERIEAAGFNPDDPVEMEIYKRSRLSEELPPDPMQALREREARLRIQGMESGLNEEDEDEVYRFGGQLGVLRPDESPAGRRFEPIAGVPQQEADRSSFIVDRVRELMAPPRDSVAAMGFTPPSVEDAVKEAASAWEAIQKGIRGTGVTPRTPPLLRGGRARQGSDVAGVTVPPRHEALPSSGGSIQFRAGSQSLERELDSLLSSLPRGANAEGIRSEIQAAVHRGESLEDLLRELRADLGM